MAEVVILFIVAILCLILLIDLARNNGFKDIREWIQQSYITLQILFSDYILVVSYIPSISISKINGFLFHS